MPTDPQIRQRGTSRSNHQTERDLIPFVLLAKSKLNSSARRQPGNTTSLFAFRHQARKSHESAVSVEVRGRLRVFLRIGFELFIAVSTSSPLDLSRCENVQ